MRTWWRRWNEIMTGEVLPPERHDELTGFYAARRQVPPKAQPAAAP